MGWLSSIAKGIGIAGDLLGITNSGKSDRKNAQAIADTNAANRLNVQETNAQNYRIHQETMRAQMDAAKNSILWRMEDAKRAGLHPLYAMGIQPAQMSGSGVTMIAPQDQAPQRGPSDMAAHMSSLGQNLSRAFTASMTKEERAQAKFDAAMAKQKQDFADNLKIRNMQLENGRLEAETALIRSQATRAAGNQVGAPAPSISDAEQVLKKPVLMKPAEVIASDPARSSQQAGVINDWKYVRTNRGLAIVPSDQMKQSMEDSSILEIPWALRNMLLPNFDARGHKPDPRRFPPPKGYSDWKWSLRDQMYVPKK